MSSAIMRVSVVIPTFNSGPYVVEAVASILAQTHPVDEVIVVDDGSTDDTAVRLSHFGLPVRYIRKENGGVSTARNRGVDEATGDLIAFLDADDVWHPKKLQAQLALMNRFPDLGLLGTRLYNWPGNHPAVEAGDLEEIEIIRLNDLIVRNSLVTSTIIVRAAELRAAGPFDLTLRGPEDHDLWIRIGQHTRMANMRAALTGYRSTTPGSLSKNASKMESGMRAILEKLERNGIFRGQSLLRRKAWAYFRYSCGFMRYRAGENGLACKHLASSILGYPLPYASREVRSPFGRVRLLIAAVLAGLSGKHRRTVSEGKGT